jgi:hypothetical protein
MLPIPGNLHFYYELPIGVCFGPFIICSVLTALVAEAILRSSGLFDEPLVIVVVFFFGWVFAHIWMFVRSVLKKLQQLWRDITSFNYGRAFESIIEGLSPAFDFLIKGFLTITIVSLIILIIYIIIRGINNRT